MLPRREGPWVRTQIFHYKQWCQIIAPKEVIFLSSKLFAVQKAQERQSETKRLLASHSLRYADIHRAASKQIHVKFDWSHKYHMSQVTGKKMGLNWLMLEQICNWHNNATGSLLPTRSIWWTRNLDPNIRNYLCIWRGKKSRKIPLG